MSYSSAQPLSPRQRYQSDIETRTFHDDPAQGKAVAHFQAVYEQLCLPPPSLPVWRRLLGKKRAPVTGLYLWGGPGRGKTYLMDCFYESLPFEEKRRVHFHRFMLEIHAALDALPKTPDPLRIVADDLALHYRVLCLDEFHITDIADAMLLGGLLEALFARHLVLVATSNLAPEELYRDGIQRERFLPSIDLLKDYCRVHCLDGKQDFRLALLQQGGTYKVMGGEPARSWLLESFSALVASKPAFDTPISLFGRELHARALADDIIWFDFASLCLLPRSARDYLELAREFHTVILQDVPRFDEDMDEAARRFMHLIDALYDHGVKLVVTAEAVPDNLYKGGQLEKSFQRTASRLTEMSSEDYLARPHRPE